MERDPMEIVVTVDILALDKMMTYLNVRDLLSCRLVSEFWNNAASSELRQRSTMIQTISNESQLMELEECMKQSWNFPFAGLKFNSPGELQSDGAKEFFKEYGTEFTSLCLYTKWTGRLDDLAPFIYHLPRLSILELGHFHSHPRTRSIVPSVGCATGRTADALSLPYLRTIRISMSWCGEFEEVLGQVLEAASPSLQIECLGVPAGILRILKSAGKLGALSVMTIGCDIGDQFQSEIDQLLATGSPSLTKLDVHALGCLSMYGLKKILFASQTTLKELHLSEICLSHMPIYEHLAFTKLTTLSFQVNVGLDREYFFCGRHQCNFPALKNLRLKMRHFVREPFRAVFVDDLVIPTVTNINLDGYVNEDGMKKLAQICPNVTEILLDYGDYSGQSFPFGSDPSDMWSVRGFKRLEKLVIWNFIVARRNQQVLAMDTFLTGIPFQECQELNLNNIPFTENLRVTPSILELKSLKHLVICFKLGEQRRLPIEHAPFISMVSVRYALQMMPELRAKFFYDPVLHEERETEELETAFQPVQEYVPLERF